VLRKRTSGLPVRMFWKASSTFEASSADVSMKERLFSPKESVSKFSREGVRRTGKLFGLFGGHRSKMSQIALVTDQHDDDVGISVISEFLEPSRHVVVGLVFADIVDEQCADRTSVVC
jgi:hypothetical protein